MRNVSGYRVKTRGLSTVPTLRCENDAHVTTCVVTILHRNENKDGACLNIRCIIKQWDHPPSSLVTTQDTDWDHPKRGRRREWRRRSPEEVPDPNSTSSQYLSGPVEPSRLHLRGEQVSKARGRPHTTTSLDSVASSGISSRFGSSSLRLSRRCRSCPASLPLPFLLAAPYGPSRYHPLCRSHPAFAGLFSCCA